MSKQIKIAFDEYGVWDETVGAPFSLASHRSRALGLRREWHAGTPQNGLEQYYNFTDALALASWLNVFVRQADIVEIACLAQSVNVISPIITRCAPPSLAHRTLS